MDYEMLVIGDAREGLDRAISVAQSGGRVAVVDAPESTADWGLLRRAANHVVCQGDSTLAAWHDEVSRLRHERNQQLDAELDSWGVERMGGSARFISSNSLEICDGTAWRIVSANQFVIGCGTTALRPNSFRVDDRFIFSVESMHQMRDIQRSVIVVGAGETGSAAAITLATLGLEVIVVDEHVSLFEVSGLLQHSFDAAPSVNIAFRLGEEVIGTEVRSNLRAVARLASGRTLSADAVLVCVGREGRTQGLNLESIGVGLDERGRVWCDSDGQTWNPDVAAVGDVVGFPRSPHSSDLGAARFSIPQAQLF